MPQTLDPISLNIHLFTACTILHHNGAVVGTMPNDRSGIFERELQLAFLRVGIGIAIGVNADS
jgi:hypothetical protein